MKKKLFVGLVTGLFMIGIVEMAQSATIMNGTFDIDLDGNAGISFNPIPWVSPGDAQAIYFWPYATPDYTIGYSGMGPGYNLAEAQFYAGDINVSDIDVVTGDLGIRIGNYSGETQTWGASIITLDFTSGSFEVFLPEFTFNSMENIYFWIADNGASYYANTSGGEGSPNISGAEAIAEGEQYLAAGAPVPLPSTILLLGTGLAAFAGSRIRRKK